jgi:hypothetical protein
MWWPPTLLTDDRDKAATVSRRSSLNGIRMRMLWDSAKHSAWKVKIVMLCWRLDFQSKGHPERKTMIPVLDLGVNNQSK